MSKLFLLYILNRLIELGDSEQTTYLRTDGYICRPDYRGFTV